MSERPTADYDAVLAGFKETWPAFQGVIDTQALDTDMVREGWPKPTIYKEHEVIHVLCNVIDNLRRVGEHQARNNCAGNMHPGSLSECKVPGCGPTRALPPEAVLVCGCCGSDLVNGACLDRWTDNDGEECRNCVIPPAKGAAP